MRLPTHHAWVSQAKALMAANEEVRSLAVWAVVHAGVPFGTNWERSSHRGCILGTFWYQTPNFRAFPVVNKKLHCVTENRSVQLATTQRNAAGKALVADAKAKNLDASPVDLLRIVKVRCRRCAPSSVLGYLPLGRPECVARGSTRVPLEYDADDACRPAPPLLPIVGVLHRLPVLWQLWCATHPAALCRTRAPHECGTECAHRRCAVDEPSPRMHRHTTTQTRRHAP
jgi:hypothetical protein